MKTMLSTSAHTPSPHTASSANASGSANAAANTNASGSANASGGTNAAPLPAIDLQHVSVRYGNVYALRDVSLSINEGEYLSLIHI